jgi:hypothetical protein
MIYVSAIRKHELADSKCINLGRNILRKKIEQNPVTYEYAEIERIDGLLMWCLAYAKVGGHSGIAEEGPGSSELNGRKLESKPGPAPDLLSARRNHVDIGTVPVNIEIRCK